MPDSDSGVASGVPMDVTQSLGSQSPGQILGQIAPGGTPGRTTNDADNTFSPLNGSKQLMVKYGELIILGYNGQLPQGDRGRRRSKFVLYRRAKPNGIVRSRHYKVSGRPVQQAPAILDNELHSISYTLSRNQAVIVEYSHDENSDLFQIGRSSESPIDFVVMDTVPGNRIVDKVSSQSTISRFACRILANRDETDLSARIYAAGFDSSRNIFLGEKATKWETQDPRESCVDGLTTNGVLVMSPNGVFCPGDSQLATDSHDNTKKNMSPAKPGLWREISVGGNVFGLRESRSAAVQGPAVPTESNVLTDGTLIDLCGATLLWRSTEGLNRSPTPRQLERCLDELNAGRPQCPVGLYTLVVPRKNNANSGVAPEAQPVVYLSCGHVQGKHNWGNLNDSKGTKTCPMCLGGSAVAQLCMGAEPGFYVDCLPPNYCFVPCGHMASEQSVKYWANVPIPCGTSGFQSACPFCAVPLTGNPGYMKLIFQDKCD